MIAIFLCKIDNVFSMNIFKQMKINRILQLGFIVLGLSVNAQSNYFKKSLKELSSDKYNGRGYTYDGMKKASFYIEKQMKKHQLKNFNQSYLQSVNFPINIIENAELKLNGKQLVYGKDFIVKPSSKSVSYTKNENYIFPIEQYIESFQSKELTRKFVENDFSNQNNKNIILPPLNIKVDSIKNYYKQWANIYEKDENQNRAIFRFTNDSLTSSLSQRQANVTEFIIKDKYFNKDLAIDNYQVKTTFNSHFKFNNVIGYLDGVNNDSVVVLTAHYDHLGRVGNAIFPGASDNASGTAMVLDLMKHYSKNKPKYKTVFMFFGAEEAGIVGAYKYVENPLFPLSDIKFLVNLDLMANGGDGIQVVNGTKFTKEFNQMVEINKETQLLKDVKVRGESCNSDHCPFDKKGVPSFFIYTLGGVGHYHSIYDSYQNLDLSYSDKVKELIIKFIDQL